MKAVVQVVDPVDASDEFGADLLEWPRDRLAHYKCPRSISFEEQLPRTDTGKIFENELVRKYGGPETGPPNSEVPTVGARPPH